VLVERGPQGADPPVHHVAGGDDVGARLRLRHRGAREQLEGQVVVDHAVVAQDAAVPVARVLAQAQVADHEQLRMRRLDGTRGELDDPFVVPGAGALLVLGGGEPEEQHGRDAERGRLARLVDRGADREVIDPGHARDRDAPVDAVAHEHRIHEVRGGQLGLPHKSAQEPGLAEAAHAGGREHACSLEPGGLREAPQ
jgi:hypothetical protein